MNPSGLHIVHPDLPAPQILEKSEAAFETVDVLDIPVAAVSHAKLCSIIYHHVMAETRGWITYANIHSLNLTYALPWLKSFFHKSLLTYCDGQGVRLGAKILGKGIPERITLPDFFDDLCFLARDHGFTLFLLGSHTETAKRAVERLHERFPGLMVTGYHGGYFSPAETPLVINVINKANPDILVVGMGIPHQEAWIQENFHHLNATIAWMAGGVLELISGRKSRCPRWMSSWGLEWLYRLFQEPRRLAKRYLLGNPLFLLRVLKQRFRNDSV